MAGILASLSLFGYVFFLRRFLRWPIEAIPLFVVSMVIVLNYAFAYAGILKPACVSMLALGGTLFLLSPLYLPKKPAELFANYFTPGFIIFIFFIIVFGMMAQTLVVFTGWDEISRWLPMAKLTYLHHNFDLYNYAQIQNEYPPGGALFYYYFLTFSAYSEGLIAYAQLFLVLSPLIIFLRKYNWENWENAVIFFTAILLLLIFALEIKLGPTATIYMDGVSGLFFGGILAAYFLMTSERNLWIYLLPPSMALVLFKPMLFPFILIITTVILCDQFLVRKQNKKNLKVVLLFSGITLLPLAILKTWFYYLHNAAHPIVSTWNLKTLLLAVWHGNTALNAVQFHSVMTKYLHSLVEPTVFLLLIVVTVVSLYKFSDRLNRKRLVYAHSLLLGGYIAYLGLLLLLYLYAMSPYIAVKLNSFERFMEIYYLGWFLLVLAHAVSFNEKFHVLQVFPKKIKLIAIYAIMVFLCIYTVIYEYSHNVLGFEAKRNKDYLRHQIKEMAVPINALLNSNAKIGIIWKYDGDNVNPNLLGYELLPRPFITMQENYSAAIFEAYLKQIDYLLVTYVPDSFWNQYQLYFKKGKGTVLNTGTFCISDNVLQVIQSYGKIRTTPCRLHQVPFYLYKVISKDNTLSLVNVLEVK
ncbi:hypothetical protein BH10PSE19_BH10PSE19_17160 [soil metagenome]